MNGSLKDQTDTPIERTRNEMLAVADKTKSEILTAAQKVKDNLTTGF